VEQFGTFFAAATGREPEVSWQRVAASGLGDFVEVPAGAVASEIVLAWLWRWLHGPELTPRRLVYVLPSSSLIEHVADQVAGWLGRLGLADQVALQVAAGHGAGHAAGGSLNWRQDMHRPGVLVGTEDTLVSKALGHGIGVGRSLHPIDFALVTNGAQWVFAEAALCPRSVATMRRLAEFAVGYGTAEPLAVTSMSGVSPGVSSVAPGSPFTVARLAADRGDYPAVAASVLAQHRPGTRTLIAANTLGAARRLHAALAGSGVPRVLIHPWFRGRERRALAEAVTGPVTDEAGQIVVATSVIEAGLETRAALVVSEVAPWSSLVLRAGHCDSSDSDRDARFRWIRPDAADGEQPELEPSLAALRALDGAAVRGLADVAGPDATAESGVPELSRPDFLALFDPDDSPDLGPWISDAGDLEAQLIWATWNSASGAPSGALSDAPSGAPSGALSGAPSGAPPADFRLPPDDWRCRARLPEVARLADRVAVWRMDWAARERWARVTPESPAWPGEILLVAAGDGGYDPVLGFDPSWPDPVPDCPSLDVPQVSEAAADEFGWISLQQHSEETRDHAGALLATMRPGLTGVVMRAIVSAAYLHDVGKAHPIWQDALCALAGPDHQERVEAGRPWAKSGGEGQLIFAGDVAFRHELASVLLIDGPLAGLVDRRADRDLVRYLVLAHHGQLRQRVWDRDPAIPGVLRGLEQGAVWPMPRILGRPEVAMTVDIAKFIQTGDRSWTQTARSLLLGYGPFVLAYLETVVRIADWRASAREPEAGPALKT
jgi:CRISPR-associated endonuclease/helicase Cas3